MSKTSNEKYNLEANKTLLSQEKVDNSYLGDGNIDDTNDILALAASYQSISKANHLQSQENDSTHTKSKSKLSKLWHRVPLKGYLLAFASAFLFSVAAVFIKLATSLSAAETSLMRYLVQFSTMFIVIKCRRDNPFGPKKQRKLLVFRGIIGTFGLLLFYFAFKFIDPSDCLAITHSSLIITSILARIFLKEKLTIAHVIALVLTINGVFFISRPNFIFGPKSVENTSQISLSFNTTSLDGYTRNDFTKYYNILGITFALLCALLSGTVQITLKKLCMHKVHFSTVTIYASYFGIPITLALSLLLVLTGLVHENISDELPLMPLHSVYVLIASFVGLTAQIFMNLAMKYEEASKIAIIKSVDVFFSFIFQYFILNITLDVFSICGSLSIIAGTFLVLVLKLLDNGSNKSGDDKTKNNELEQKNNNFFIQCIQFKF